jgi:hypothetical protein
MSHVSSVAKSSFPYRGTLAEIDLNGDGVVSREEIAAAQRPGILSRNLSEGSGSAPLGSVMAILMRMGGGDFSANGSNPMLSDDTAECDLKTALTAYRNTYGQYDLDGTGT